MGYFDFANTAEREKKTTQKKFKTRPLTRLHARQSPGGNFDV